MSYADVQELEDELRQKTTEYDDLDFKQKLKYANSRLPGMVGRKFIESKTIEFDEETDVELDFASLVSFDKVVEAKDNEVIDSSNYSVDIDTATVNFDQSYVDDNFFKGFRLKFYYVPDMFKLLEIDVAIRRIFETELIHTADDVTNTQVDQINNRIQGHKRQINSRNSTFTQSGDNQDRGSQPPRRLGGN